MNYNIAPELFNKYNEIKRKFPNIDNEMIMKFAEEMPTIFEMSIMEYEHGCHIVSERMYNEAVSFFENFNGTEGAYWDVNTIKMKANIDFNNFKDYTLYDLAYMANMHYSDYGDFLSADMLIKMAKRDLEDKDYPGDPTERAFKDAKKRIRYFKND